MLNNSNHLQQRLSQIQILVIEGSAKASQLVTRIFSELGFSNCIVANDAIEGLHVMQTLRINVLYVDADIRATLEGGASKASVKAVNFVKSLRHSKASPNPFLPIVMMMDSTTNEEFKIVRDSGVNEILLRPIDAENFCKRLISIIQKPRLFITAPTYKGPCRRLENKGYKGKEDRRKAEVVLIKSKGRRR